MLGMIRLVDSTEVLEPAEGELGVIGLDWPDDPAGLDVETSVSLGRRLQGVVNRLARRALQGAGVLTA